MCGGTARWGFGDPAYQGLSPRVRGNHEAARDEIMDTGSIPACAGEPMCLARTVLPEPVYPRVCGGTSSSIGRSISLNGLSPRVRGNLRVRIIRNKQSGSIPACAGEPPQPTRMRRMGGVYPRVCGGTISTCACWIPSTGLSPRVRGNHCAEHVGIGRERSIPACAGEPTSTTRSRTSKQVYPRVCGGTQYVRRQCWRAKGLSPRVRGNPGPHVQAGPRSRSIPACAGEPISEAISSFQK